MTKEKILRFVAKISLDGKLKTSINVENMTAMELIGILEFEKQKLIQKLNSKIDLERN